jgi:hypothetical protein
MKSSIPKNCPTSEIKLKLIPRGSHNIPKRKENICIRRVPPQKNPKQKVITKAKNRPTLV